MSYHDFKYRHTLPKNVIFLYPEELYEWLTRNLGPVAKEGAKEFEWIFRGRKPVIDANGRWFVKRKNGNLRFFFKNEGDQTLFLIMWGDKSK